MSQIVRIKKTQMVERGYLIQALEDLGYRWTGNARIGLSGPHVDIKVRGRNVGFRQAGRAYEMVTRGVSVRRTKFLQQVTQRYAYHVARAKLEEQGFALSSEEMQQDGRIHLVLRRMV
jgi:hypothetical protein